MFNGPSHIWSHSVALTGQPMGEIHAARRRQCGRPAVGSQCTDVAITGPCGLQSDLLVAKQVRQALPYGRYQIHHDGLYGAQGELAPGTRRGLAAIEPIAVARPNLLLRQHKTPTLLMPSGACAVAYRAWPRWAKTASPWCTTGAIPKSRASPIGRRTRMPGVIALLRPVFCCNASTLPNSSLCVTRSLPVAAHLSARAVRWHLH
jgi:hypothetical protein